MIAYINMTKELVLMHLANKDYITPEDHERLSKSILISVQQPNIISRWFYKRSLQLTISEISDIHMDLWSGKKKKQKPGLVSIPGGRNDSNTDKGRQE